MPKVAQKDLEDFGRAAKRARSLKGWTLDQLSAALQKSTGKSFLSDIEKGKRPIGPVTVGKLIAALDKNAMGLGVCIVLAALTFVAIALLRWPLAWVLLGIGGGACLWAWRVLGRLDEQRHHQTRT